MAGVGCIGLFRKWSSWRRGCWRRRCWILRATLKEGLMKSEKSCATLDFWAELPYELGCSLYRKDHMLWSISQRWWSLHDPAAIGWHVTGSLQIHSLSLLSLLSFLSLLNSDFERKDLVCTWTKVRESEKITKTRLHDIVERNASHIIVWTWSFAGALACGERELHTSPKLLD